MALTNCGLVLLVATITLFGFQVWNFRSNFQSDSIVLASIIAKNSAAALAMADAQSATEVINSLQAQPNLVAAYLALPDGSLLTRLERMPTQQIWHDFRKTGNSPFSTVNCFTPSRSV